MISKVFAKQYGQLNTEQKEAVDSIEGPVMVIAGPGTGKTQILTLRIANILKKTDTNPENILALTFTESAAYSMRKRLVDIIGSSAYRVQISTFHGFCNDIIKKFPEDFPRIISSRNMGEVDQIRIIQETIENTPLKELKPYGDKFYYLYPIIRALSDLKRENIDPQSFEKMIRRVEADFGDLPDLYHESGAYRGQMKSKYAAVERRIKKNKELARVYRSYEKELEKAKLYDYDDMIMEVYRVLSKNKNLLAALQEEYQYLLVDEHQDTNRAQNQVVELLASFYENPNVFVVGDEKQAIFRFQGASIENFLYFKKLYPRARLITLEKNYRSNQGILDSAHSLITKSGEGLEEFRKELKSVKDEEVRKIEVYGFSGADFEHGYVAHDIKLKIKSGVLPGEIAVLYRENADSEEIAKSLDREGIEYAIESDEDILSDRNLNKLILIFRAIDSFGEKAAFLNMIHVDFLGVDELDIYKLINAERGDFYGLIKNRENLKSLGIENPEKIVALYRLLSAWYKSEKNKNLLEFFEIVVKESGYLEHILSGGTPVDDMERLNGFFEELKLLIEAHREAKLKDLIKYLDLLRDHGVSLKYEIRKNRSGQVRLMTAHRSKGLEFEYVYIINAYDGHWGNKKKPNPLRLITASEISEASDSLADERRLFYVALTRAKAGVKITYSKEGKNGPQLPSQFIEEIDRNFLEHHDASVYENRISKNKKSFGVPEKTEPSLRDKEYLNSLFLDYGLSVTALNNYLECPWRYFYNNLVRIPTAIENSQMYGIALHDTLKAFSDKFKTGAANKKLFLDLLDKNFKRQPFGAKDYAAFFARAKKSLGGYYDTYAGIWSKNILNEFNVRGVLLEDKIKIGGKLDKVEILNDRNEVVVYDYKTAKPKSRNEIEGKTRNSEGNYKRQLVFYKLLLDNYGSSGGEPGKYKMVQGVIDFLEPNERGKYVREAFEITKDEAEELKALIKKVSKEILNLSFWNEKCRDKKCDYCRLRGLMR